MRIWRCRSSLWGSEQPWKYEYTTPKSSTHYCAGMAFVSHVTANQEDYMRPSFFELVAESALLDSLKPALQSLLTIGAENFPRMFPIVKYSDELYHSFLYLVHNHYLVNNDASFSENFYMLKRIQLRDGVPISDHNRRMSLLFLVGIPYIASSLERKYNSLLQSPTPHSHLGTRVFMKLYPYVHALKQGSRLWFLFMYLFKRTEFPSLSYYLMRITLRRLSNEDYSDFEKRTLHPYLATDATVFTRLSRVLSVLFGYVKLGLIFAIFAYKFLEWWYASEDKLHSGGKLPVPPPPDSIPPSKLGIRLPISSKDCPLCYDRRTNAACINSGYVFCYPCIFRYVSSNNRCPVTLRSATTEEIRTVYEAN